MAEHTLAVRRRAAVRHLTCPECEVTPTNRCVNDLGEERVPHDPRLALADIWFTGYDQAAATVNRLETELLEANTSRQSAQTALQECKAQSAALEEQVADLNAELSLTISTLEIAQEGNRSLSDQLSQAKSRIVALESAINVLDSALERRDAEIVDLKAEIKRLTTTTPPTPAPGTRMLVGAAYYSNINKTDGVEAAAGVPYDAVRIYASDGSLAKRDLMVSLIKKAAGLGNKHVVVSAKPPASWATMASGAQDAWIKSYAKAMSDAAVLYKVTVWLIFSHEPENDTGTNDGGTTAGRDAWKAYQARAGSLIKGKYANVLFGPCLMGYHSTSKASTYPLWKLENCIPDATVIDFVMFDLYEDSTNVPVVYKMLADYCNARGLKHGLGEYGIHKADYAGDPTQMNKTVALMKQTGSAMLAYYNTSVANTQDPNFETTYAMEPGGPRYKNWVQILKAKSVA